MRRIPATIDPARYAGEGKGPLIAGRFSVAICHTVMKARIATAYIHPRITVSTVSSERYNWTKASASAIQEIMATLCDARFVAGGRYTIAAIVPLTINPPDRPRTVSMVRDRSKNRFQSHRAIPNKMMAIIWNNGNVPISQVPNIARDGSAIKSQPTQRGMGLWPARYTGLVRKWVVCQESEPTSEPVVAEP